MKKVIKSILKIVLVYAIFVGFALALCERNERLDQKKELPATTQSNSLEK